MTPPSFPWLAEWLREVGEKSFEIFSASRQIWAQQTKQKRLHILIPADCNSGFIVRVVIRKPLWNVFMLTHLFPIRLGVTSERRSAYHHQQKEQQQHTSQTIGR